MPCLIVNFAKMTHKPRKIRLSKLLKWLRVSRPSSRSKAKSTSSLFKLLISKARHSKFPKSKFSNLFMAFLKGYVKRLCSKTSDNLTFMVKCTLKTQ